MTIFLYIIRHGEAEPISATDELRQLTEHGCWEAKRTALWLKTQIEQFHYVFSSPYIRAMQTRDIVEDNGCAMVASEVLAELTPSGDAQLVVDYIATQIKEEPNKDINIGCFSHMPIVSYLIGELTGYTPIMATAGVAKIKLEPELWKGQLETLLAPEQML